METSETPLDPPLCYSANTSAQTVRLRECCRTIVYYSHIYTVYKTLMLGYILLPLAVTLDPANESLALCFDSSLVITCTTTGDLVWRLIPYQGSFNSLAPKVYRSTSSLQGVDMIDDFVVRLESKHPLVSTATLDEIAPKHNGSVLMCAINNFPDSDEFANITILVKGV